MYQNRRWDSDFRTVKKIIKGGLLSNLIEYKSPSVKLKDAKNTIKLIELCIESSEKRAGIDFKKG